MAAGDEIKTSWSADFSEINSAFAETSQVAAEGFKEVEKSAEEAAANIQKHTQRRGEGFAGVGEAVEGIASKLSTFAEATGIALAAEAVEKLGEAIEGAAEKGVEIANMSEVLGVTTDQFQTLADAAEEAGVNLQQVEHAGIRLNAMLDQARQGVGDARDKLHLLGITNAEIADSSFKLIEAFQQIHDKLENAATSAQTMTALTEALGPRATLVAQALKEFDGSAEGVAKVMDEINGLTGEQVKELQQLHAEYNRIEDVVSNAWKKVVVSIGEAIEGTVEFIKLSGEIPDIIENFSAAPEGFEGSFGDIGAVEAQLKAASEQQMEANRRAVSEQLSGVQQVSQAQMASTKVEMQLAKEAMDSDRAASEAKVADATRYAELVGEYYGKDSENYRAAVVQKTQVERQFHDFVDELARSSQALELSIQSEWYQAHAAGAEKLRQLDQQAAKERAAVEMEAAKQVESAALASIEAQLEAAKAAFAAREISAQQEADIETRLAAQKLAVQQRYYQTLKGFLAADSVEQLRVQGQEQAAFQAFSLSTQRIADQTAARIKQSWQGVTSAMSTSLAQSIEGMLAKTQTFADSMRSLFASIIDALIQKFAEWAVAQLADLILVHETSSTNARSQIAANAGVAGAAATASAAAIPVYGWAIAPGVGASVAEATMGFESLAAYEGGGVVPEDMLAYVHKDEHVLPAQFNQGLTNLINSFSANGGQGTESGNQRAKTVHLHVHDGGGDDLIVRKGNLVDLLMELNARFAFSR